MRFDQTRCALLPSPAVPTGLVGTNNSTQHKMKKIEAIIKPFKLEEVKDALGEVGIEGMTVSEVKGFRPPEGPHRNLSRQRIHRGLPAENQNRTGRDRPAIDQGGGGDLQSAKTGKIGDGKIFVSSVEQAVRIRTEEKGDSAV
jgi:nitrogen regulatory protein PII